MQTPCKRTPDASPSPASACGDVGQLNARNGDVILPPSGLPINKSIGRDQRASRSERSGVARSDMMGGWGGRAGHASPLSGSSGWLGVGVLFVGEARHPDTSFGRLLLHACMHGSFPLAHSPSPSPTLRSADGKAGCRPHVRVPARPRPAAGYLALTRRRLTADGQRYQAEGNVRQGAMSRIPIGGCGWCHLLSRPGAHLVIQGRQKKNRTMSTRRMMNDE